MSEEPSSVVERASVRDVARRAGVSIGTVSNVLNHPHRVAPETRARVELAIGELRFTRNPFARQLRRGRSDSIGVVALDVANPFWGEVIRGIESVTYERGYSVILTSSEESKEKEARVLHVLEERRVAGLLIAPVQREEYYLAHMQERGRPIVLLDHQSETGQLSSVAVDDVHGGKLAARHLFELGHRRIAFVNGPVSIPWCADRASGVDHAVREAGLERQSAILEITTSTLTAREGEAIVDKILNADPRPTAVFCANDLLALGVLRSLFQRGVAVPEELALVGYDDVNFARVLSPPLTSVRQPPYELGRAAAQILLEDTASLTRLPPRQVLFQPELIVRQSSVKPSAS